MIFPAVSSVIQIGPVQAHWYGLFVIGGIAAGYVIIRRLIKFSIFNFSRHSELPQSIRNENQSAGQFSIKEFDSLFFYLIIYGFIGARLYHVLNEPIYYWNHPIDIFKVWNGGLAIHGSVIVGILVIFYFVPRIVIPGFDPESKQQKQTKKEFPVSPFFFGFLDSRLRGNDGVRKFFVLSDLLVVGLALGQAIGRWGNYFNQELFGKPTNGFFKVFIDAANRPVGFENIVYYHPTFLYESVLNLVLFIILFILYKRTHSVIPNLIPASPAGGRDPNKNTNKKRFFDFFFSFLDSRLRSPRWSFGEAGGNDSQVANYQLPITGYVTSFYLLGYGFVRFFVDFLRIDPRPFFGGLYLSQWVSLAMIVIGVVIWYTARKASFNSKL